jgi:hypothetical protein
VRPTPRDFIIDVLNHSISHLKIGDQYRVLARFAGGVGILYRISDPNNLGPHDPITSTVVF